MTRRAKGLAQPGEEEKVLRRRGTLCAAVLGWSCMSLAPRVPQTHRSARFLGAGEPCVAGFSAVAGTRESLRCPGRPRCRGSRLLPGEPKAATLASSQRMPYFGSTWYRRYCTCRHQLDQLLLSFNSGLRRLNASNFSRASLFGAPLHNDLRLTRDSTPLAFFTRSELTSCRCRRDGFRRGFGR